MTNPSPDLIDSDGENRAVRSFLLQWGVNGLTVGAMRKHMERSGWGAQFCPAFAMLTDQHLTKAGAQLWIRHLFSMESMKNDSPERKPQVEADPRVEDLAMLVRRLVWRLEKDSPGTDLAPQALDYLKRKGLAGSPLRAGEVPQVEAESVDTPEFLGRVIAAASEAMSIGQGSEWDSFIAHIDSIIAARVAAALTRHLEVTGDMLRRKNARIEELEAAALAASQAAPASADKDAAIVEDIRAAIKGYYRALCDRQHGGVAQDRAFGLIQMAMCMTWDGYKAGQPVQAAPAKAEGWISVEQQLPDSARDCLAVYVTQNGKQRRIRAYYAKQFEIEASGDECDSETREDDDTEWLKSGWYECIDNWGEYSSVAVTEGTVTHWQPMLDLPAAPSTQPGEQKP